jgi:SNF2 family DNA or RNA helicase
MYENNEKIILPVKEASTAFLAIDWATVIVDEAHQTLAGATGNLKTQSAQSRGLRLLTVRQDGLRLALSGTPFRGKHENIWGILDWLDSEGTPAYWNWIKRHFDVYMDYVIGCEVIGGLKDEKKLAQELRSVMIRRTKKQVVKELPDKLYGGGPVDPDHKPPPESSSWSSEKIARWYNKYNPIAVWLDMDGKQRKAYEQMCDVAMADIEGGTLMANSILAEIIRLKQFANSYGFLDDQGVFRPQLPSNKFEWILEFLEERNILGEGGSGSKVVIASQFTKHINLFAYELRERYKTNCFVLTGATNEEQRVQYQREFQKGTTDAGNPSADVFLLNSKAGGVSLTLDAADDIILIDNTRNPDDQLQVVDRVHRISRIHQVTVWNLATRESVDENIIRDEHLMGMSLARILDQGGTDAVKRLIVG